MFKSIWSTANRGTEMLAMPHPPHQKSETRKRILQSARRLFNRSGFAGVSIEDIMARGAASTSTSGPRRNSTRKP